MPLLSPRTRWLALAALTLSIALGIVIHNRQALCAEVSHGFARRAPIASASGTDTFVCYAMIERLPAAEVVLGIGWWFAVLALVRSFRIDAYQRRLYYSRPENLPEM